MLHCIKQVISKGGESQFCDGFKVAEDLRSKAPDVFHILSTFPIDFHDKVLHMKHSTPLIQ